MNPYVFALVFTGGPVAVHAGYHIARRIRRIPSRRAMLRAYLTAARAEGASYVILPTASRTAR